MAASKALKQRAVSAHARAGRGAPVLDKPTRFGLWGTLVMIGVFLSILGIASGEPGIGIVSAFCWFFGLRGLGDLIFPVPGHSTNPRAASHNREGS